jgi:hypothetical protein
VDAAAPCDDPVEAGVVLLDESDPLGADEEAAESVFVVDDSADELDDVELVPVEGFESFL